MSHVICFSLARKVLAGLLVLAFLVMLVPPAVLAEPGYGDGLWYVVRRGDTLSQVAARHNTTTTAIALANGIRNTSMIRIGQRLWIATGGAGAPPPASPLPAGSRPAPAPTPAPKTIPPAAPVPPQPKVDAGRLVLANYFAWYDASQWGDCNISAGDKPAELYSSDDPATFARHIRQAGEAGIDGFTLQWFAPGERTDRNLQTLLEQSRGKPFRSTVVFLRQIWPGSPAPTQQNVAEAVRYLLEHYGGHPNFLTIGGKPVLIFADVPRVPVAAGQTPQQAWAAIRAQADPEGKSLWIAEGLDATYLSVFDGLYVYKITHASYPRDYIKATRWAASVHQWERRTGKQKFWFATISPGWDDLRSACRADVRVASQPHRVDRQDGAFYRATFRAATGSNPDGLWINSFNEWVEGSYLEPSAQYGDRYLQLTRELAAAFKGG